MAEDKNETNPGISEFLFSDISGLNRNLTEIYIWIQCLPSPEIGESFVGNSNGPSCLLFTG